MPKTIETEQTGTLIRRLRRVSGMTQMSLADKMGVTYQQVQKYEKGVSELTIRRLRQVADALNVPVSTFLPEDGGIAEPDASYLTDEEATLLTLFRKLKRKKLRQGFVDMLRDILEVAD